jgi:SAM-dependent methyltransferase
MGLDLAELTARQITSARIDKALIPPAEALPPYARHRDFADAGAAFVRTAAERGLEPHHRVLDLGCGVGRFAVAFAAFGDDRASYHGLDASAESIGVCNRYIAPDLERFRFHVADVFSAQYRPDVTARAADYRFPFPDDSFDFVFSNSLFTHLTRQDLQRYLHEIGRVLDSGGRTLNTFFLLNAQSRAGIESGKSQLEFPYTTADGIARVKRIDRPEAAIAYEETFIRQAHAQAGLRIEDPIRYGEWPGREASQPGFNNHDFIVAICTGRGSRTKF